MLLASHLHFAQALNSEMLCSMLKCWRHTGLRKGLLSSRQGGRPQLPAQMRMPHTTQIRPVGEDAVELDFLAVDSLLGARLGASVGMSQESSYLSSCSLLPSGRNKMPVASFPNKE